MAYAGSIPSPPVAPLAMGWTENVDPATANTFYHNGATGETSWTRPASEAPVLLPTHYPLPEGWSEHADAATASIFYHCATTGETRWERPVPLPPAPLAAGPVSQQLAPGLPGAFLGYLQMHPEVLENIRDYQADHCHLFVGQEAEEYPLQASHSYDMFVGLIDAHLNAFLMQNGATSEQFADALLEMKKDNNPHFMAFDLLLRKVDFQTLAGLMRNNTCLCCGGAFMGKTPAAAGPA